MSDEAVLPELEFERKCLAMTFEDYAAVLSEASARRIGEGVEGWVEQAKLLLPCIVVYLSLLECYTPGSGYAVNLMLNNGDHESAHRWFNNAWGRLPDHPGIRKGAFFLLCDLCSEYYPEGDRAHPGIEEAAASIE